jgi:hypothetical protein
MHIQHISSTKPLNPKPYTSKSRTCSWFVQLSLWLLSTAPRTTKRQRTARLALGFPEEAPAAPALTVVHESGVLDAGQQAVVSSAVNELLRSYTDFVPVSELGVSLILYRFCTYFVRAWAEPNPNNGWWNRGNCVEILASCPKVRALRSKGITVTMMVTWS